MTKNFFSKEFFKEAGAKGGKASRRKSPPKCKRCGEFIQKGKHHVCKKNISES